MQQHLCHRCPSSPHHAPASSLPPQGLLGEKKRSKTLSALKECDVAVLVVDVARHLADPSLDMAWERQLLAGATKYGAVPLLLYNLKGSALGAASSVLQRLQASLDPEGAVASLVLDLHDGAQDVAGTVAGFLQEGVKSSRGRAQVGRSRDCSGRVWVQVWVRPAAKAWLWGWLPGGGAHMHPVAVPRASCCHLTPHVLPTPLRSSPCPSGPWPPTPQCSSTSPWTRRHPA